MNDNEIKMTDKAQHPILRVRLEVFVPYKDGSGKGNAMDSEVFIDITKNIGVGEVMKKVKEGVVDIMKAARRHKAEPPRAPLPLNIAVGEA